MDSNRASILVIYRYALKTKKVEIILFGLVKLLIALTAIYKLISLLTYLSASVTALTSRIVMSRLSVHVYMSTDLTRERHVYIDRLTSYIDLHTTSFVNIHSHLVPHTLTVGTYCDSKFFLNNFVSLL